MTSPAPVADPIAQAVFGAGLPVAERYAELLVGAGVERGVIGPAEHDRIWDRHLVNCALLGELLPTDARVVDVGSGAGLPGLALACARPDLTIDLVESLARRVDFLHLAVAELGVGDRVRVVRGRAEARDVDELVGDGLWVTARAVAPLDRLASWCLPLLRRGGRLLALKGAQAKREAHDHADAVRRAGGTIEGVVACGTGVVAEPAQVIVVRRR